MKKREIELLLAYFINYRQFLENEVIALRQNLRYRSVDAVDCLELALASERLHSFEEFSKNVQALLKLYTCEYEKEN